MTAEVFKYCLLCIYILYSYCIIICSATHTFLLQVEQEIDLVLGTKDVVKAGTTAWVTKWTPAILQHSDTLTGKLGALYKQNQMACHDMSYMCTVT